MWHYGSTDDTDSDIQRRIIGKRRHKAAGNSAKVGLGKDHLYQEAHADNGDHTDDRILPGMKRYLIIWVDRDGRFWIHNALTSGLQEALTLFLLAMEENPQEKIRFQEVFSITLTR